MDEDTNTLSDIDTLITQSRSCANSLKWLLNAQHHFHKICTTSINAISSCQNKRQFICMGKPSSFSWSAPLGYIKYHNRTTTVQQAIKWPKGCTRNIYNVCYKDTYTLWFLMKSSFYYRHCFSMILYQV